MYFFMAPQSLLGTEIKVTVFSFSLSPLSKHSKHEILHHNRPTKGRSAALVLHDSTRHMLCHCEALVTLRFRHLGHHFMKPDVFDDISLSKTLQCVQDVGLLNGCATGLRIILIPVKVHGSLQCLPFCILFYSILFHSILFLILQLHNYIDYVRNHAVC